MFPESIYQFNPGTKMSKQQSLEGYQDTAVQNTNW